MHPFFLALYLSLQNDFMKLYNKQIVANRNELIVDE